MVVDKGVGCFLDELLQSLIYHCFQGRAVLGKGGGGEARHRGQGCVGRAGEGHGSGAVGVGHRRGKVVEMGLSDELGHGGRRRSCGGNSKGGGGCEDWGGGSRGSVDSCSGPDLFHSKQVSSLFGFLSGQNVSFSLLVVLLLLLELLLLRLLLDEEFSLMRFMLSLPGGGLRVSLDAADILLEVKRLGGGSAGGGSELREGSGVVDGLSGGSGGGAVDDSTGHVLRSVTLLSYAWDKGGSRSLDTDIRGPGWVSEASTRRTRPDTR